MTNDKTMFEKLLEMVETEITKGVSQEDLKSAQEFGKRVSRKVWDAFQAESNGSLSSWDSLGTHRRELFTMAIAELMIQVAAITVSVDLHECGDD